MNLKLILSGIVLISLLVACADRNDEEMADAQSKNVKLDKKRLNRVKIITDSVNASHVPINPPSINEPAANETIDPTKPDRPK
jgi:outer membrane biosynthesis protein TonB